MRRMLVLLGTAIAGSQAGHLVAYQVRFGGAAQATQSSGMHAYFPAEVKAALGLAALALLGSLLLVAVARGLARGAHVRVAAGMSYLNLLAALFTLQLTMFVAQEVVESIVAGAALASPATLILWGTVGQLPVAAALATALRWLWTRVVEAVRQLLAITPAVRMIVPAAPVALMLVRIDDQASWIAWRSPRPRRGPPQSS